MSELVCLCRTLQPCVRLGDHHSGMWGERQWLWAEAAQWGFTWGKMLRCKGV